MKLFYSAFLICFLWSVSTSAQELSVEGGKSITSFAFKDVLATDLDNLRSTNHTYLNFGYRSNLFGEQVKYIVGLGVHTYGAVGSAEASNSFFEYETTFASVHVGLDLQVIRSKRFSMHAKLLVAPEFMLQGTQVLDNQVIDIRGADDFDTPVIFLRGALSLEYKITKEIATFFQFRYGQGKQLNGSDSGGELTYFSQDFGLGLLFSLKKKKEEKMPKATSEEN